MAYPVSPDKLALRLAIGIRARGFDDLTDRDYATLIEFDRDSCSTFSGMSEKCADIGAKAPSVAQYSRAQKLADDMPEDAVLPPETGTVRMYPIHSCPVVDGVPTRRRPTADEVAHYLSHPRAELIEADHWLRSLFTGARKRFDGFLTDEQLAAVHPDHAAMLPQLSARPGRPAISSGEQSTTLTFRLSSAQRAKLDGLGGADWIRRQIDGA